MDPEDAALIATLNAEMVAMLGELDDDGLANAMAEIQAEEDERMAPFWHAMEASMAELVRHCARWKPARRSGSSSRRWPK